MQEDPVEVFDWEANRREWVQGRRRERGRAELERDARSSFSCAMCARGDRPSQLLLFYFAAPFLNFVLLPLATLVMAIVELSGLGNGGLDGIGIFASVVALVHIFLFFIWTRLLVGAVIVVTFNSYVIQAPTRHDAENLFVYLLFSTVVGVTVLLYIVFVFCNILLGAMICAVFYVVCVISSVMYSLDYIEESQRIKSGGLKWSVYTAYVIAFLWQANAFLSGLCLVDIYG